MSVKQETTIKRYIGATADVKPTGVPIGSTYFDWQANIIYKTYDGTNWVLYQVNTTGSGDASQATLLQVKAKTDYITVPEAAAESSVVMDGTEKTLYEKTDNVLNNIEGYIDLDSMASADTIIIRQYMKIKTGGAYSLYNIDTYAGVQAVPLLHLVIKQTKNAVKVTAEQTTIGSYRTLDCQFFRRVG